MPCHAQLEIAGARAELKAHSHLVHHGRRSRCERLTYRIPAANGLGPVHPDFHVASAFLPAIRELQFENGNVGGPFRQPANGPCAIRRRATVRASADQHGPIRIRKPRLTGAKAHLGVHAVHRGVVDGRSGIHIREDQVVEGARRCPATRSWRSLVPALS